MIFVLLFKGIGKFVYEVVMMVVLCGVGVEVIVLVGYMWLLLDDFVVDWCGWIVNIYFLLLFKYKGFDIYVCVIVVDDVVGGCLVYVVIEEFDVGEVLG